MNIKLKVSNEMIFEALTTAFEGGSNYWCEEDHRTNPKHWTWFERGNDRKIKYLQLYPINGGAVYLKEVLEDGDKPHLKMPFKLDQGTIRRGIAIMAVEFPNLVMTFAGMDMDADEADIFLQLCVFGKLIYG